MDRSDTWSTSDACRRLLPRTTREIAANIYQPHGMAQANTHAYDLDSHVRRRSAKSQAGATDEQSTGTGWHTQGRIHPDVGWKARTVGRQRPTLCRLGDIPPQG